jgi:MYND finger
MEEKEIALATVCCINPGCVLVSSSDLKYCAKCGAAAYCSRDCQTSHWSSHKKLCKVLSPYKPQICMLPGPELKVALAQMQLDIPPVHEEYLRRFGPSPVITWIAEARRIVADVMRSNVSDLFGNDKQAEDILSRWHEVSPNLSDFVKHAIPGDVFLEKQYIEYSPRAPQQFRNTPLNVPLIIKNGTTMIDIGFVDFGIVIDSIHSIDENGPPIHIFGVEKEPICVAKALVMYTMARNQRNSARSIVEVWLSSLWTEETYDGFRSAVDIVLKLDTLEKTVRKILVYWKKSERMTRQASIRFHLLAAVRQRPVEFCTSACNLESERDRTDYLRYHFTKAFYEDELTVVGSSVMSREDATIGIKQLGANAFEAVPASIHLRNRQGFDPRLFLIERSRDYFESNVKQYMKLVQKGVIVFTPRLGKISLQNASLLAELAHLDPYVVSWSNVVDYLHPREFHSIARLLSGKDTMHFFHSVNWVTTVYGTDPFDIHEDGRLPAFATGLLVTEVARREFHGFVPHGPFHFRNIGSIMLTRKFVNCFLRYFFSEQAVTCGSIFGESTVIPPPAQLTRTNNTLFLAFAYADSDIVFRQPYDFTTDK